MAPKRSTPLENPPAASSSEEEKESSSEEGKEGSGSKSEAESGSESQETHSAKKSESESDSESESETESDTDEEQNDSEVKPIASKPMDESLVKSAKPKSKPVAKGKRASEGDSNPKDSKKAKKKESENGVVTEKSEDTKKQLFQRLWSEGDEIIVLKGIIDFSEKKGVDAMKDLSAFFDFIKKSVHFPATLSQLKDKISRLKKRFDNHVKSKQGEDKTFSKSHDQKLFDLSKKIWGVEGSVKPSNKAVKSKSRTKKVVNSNGGSKSLAELKTEVARDEKETEKVDKIDADKESGSGFVSVGVGGMEEYVLGKGLEMMDDEKKVELEEKWRKLHVAELELFVQRNDLIGEQAKLMLAAYRNK